MFYIWKYKLNATINARGCPYADFLPAVEENELTKLSKLKIYLKTSLLCETLILCVLRPLMNLFYCILYLLHIISGRKKDFLILTTARSGSTLLVDQLNRHPYIHCKVSM